VGEVRHPARPLADAVGSSAGGELARLLRHRVALYEERRPVHLIDMTVVGVAIQTDSKMPSVSAQEHTYELEMWDGVATQESAGALERASGERGRRKASALMMLGRECLTLMKRMTSIALSEASGHGERRP
jgi:hypothetical protein